MKKLLERMKSYSFWISFSGALVLFINCIGKIFNFQIDNKIVEDVVMSIAGLLVVLGFITKETKNSATSNENENLENKNLEDKSLSNENLNTNLNDTNLEDKSLSNENLNDEKLKDEKRLDNERTSSNSQDILETHAHADIDNKARAEIGSQVQNDKDK